MILIAKSARTKESRLGKPGTLWPLYARLTALLYCLVFSPITDLPPLIRKSPDKTSPCSNEMIIEFNSLLFICSDQHNTFIYPWWWFICITNWIKCVISWFQVFATLMLCIHHLDHLPYFILWGSLHGCCRNSCTLLNCGLLTGTTPVLSIMYNFVPSRWNRPIDAHELFEISTHVLHT